MADLTPPCKECDCPSFQVSHSPFHQGTCMNPSCKHPKGAHEKKECESKNQNEAQKEESKENNPPKPKRLRTMSLENFACFKKARAIAKTGHAHDYAGRSLHFTVRTVVLVVHAQPTDGSPSLTELVQGTPVVVHSRNGKFLGISAPLEGWVRHSTDEGFATIGNIERPRDNNLSVKISVTKQGVHCEDCGETPCSEHDIYAHRIDCGKKRLARQCGWELLSEDDFHMKFSISKQVVDHGFAGNTDSMDPDITNAVTAHQLDILFHKRTREERSRIKIQNKREAVAREAERSRLPVTISFIRMGVAKFEDKVLQKKSKFARSMKIKQDAAERSLLEAKSIDDVKSAEIYKAQLKFGTTRIEKNISISGLTKFVKNIENSQKVEVIFDVPRKIRMMNRRNRIISLPYYACDIVVMYLYICLFNLIVYF
eukprot:270254_1